VLRKSIYISAFFILIFGKLSAQGNQNKYLVMPNTGGFFTEDDLKENDDSLNVKYLLKNVEEDIEDEELVHEEDFEEEESELNSTLGETIYGFWINDRVHPYKFDIKTTKLDTTVHLFCKETQNPYFHPTCGHITSDFGMRRRRYHYGIDIKLETGDPVFCALDGVVRVSKFDRTYGNVVVVRHPNGLETLYAHLSERNVNPDDAVKAGDVLGLGGNTGRSFGAHLHFEVRYKGFAINPNEIIDFENGEVKTQILDINANTFEYLKKAKRSSRGGRYIVRRGDTMYKIAKKHGTSVKSLAKLNRISVRTKLRPGRSLKV
jgi:murein DD-endopeptidase MepM/ murein hydrolase activator NlpD